MKQLTKTYLALFAASSLLLSGCSGKTSQSGEAIKVKPSDYLEASYDELKDGGELTLAISEIPEQMNPWHGDSTADTT
ncbi:ABC transporter family substrate-binding protein, partial [Actinomycetaceae bacterium TAE3-ERU4]|nr:ABC transporter family substrate-binding protein [Actinomycetaceae bacterium TAE3-ERU4]